MSILIPMIRGYLLVNRGYDELHRNFLIRDSEQIAKRFAISSGGLMKTIKSAALLESASS
jgi:hypothetical protein